MMKKPSIVLFVGILAIFILAVLHIVQNKAGYEDIIVIINIIAACFYFAAG